MTDTAEHPAIENPGGRGLRIDSQTTLSMALVLTLVGGGIQYGRQSQRIESMEREIAAMSAQIAQLTDAVTSLRVAVRQSAGGH